MTRETTPESRQRHHVARASFLLYFILIFLHFYAFLLTRSYGRKCGCDTTTPPPPTPPQHAALPPQRVARLLPHASAHTTPATQMVPLSALARKRAHERRPLRPWPGGPADVPPQSTTAPPLTPRPSTAATRFPPPQTMRCAGALPAPHTRPKATSPMSQTK